MPRSSLRTRLVVLCVGLVAASIATTAAIVSLSATASIQHEYSQHISSDSVIYNQVLGYAATHPSWAGLTSEQLRSLVPGSREVTITTPGHQVLAATSVGSPQPGPTVTPAAAIDPLAPDSSLSTAARLGGIDSRAVGPFALSTRTKAAIDAAARIVYGCLKASGYPNAAVAHYSNGRAYVSLSGLATDFKGTTCMQARPSYRVSGSPGPITSAMTAYALVTRPTGSEISSAEQLNRLFDACAAGTLTLDVAVLSKLVTRVDFVGNAVGLEAAPDGQACLTRARRAQLAGFVAPVALLYISGDIATNQHPGLSDAAIRRIVLAALVILLVAVLAVLIAAGGVTRPLRALTRAVEQVGDSERPMQLPTAGTKEVAALAGAFNQMSAQLVVAEGRRREMISDVAHELRAPLGNIRGWLEAIQDDVASPGPRLIASLLDESLLLQAIIDDLQVLALADTDQFVIHPEPIDLGDVLGQTVAAQRPQAATKGLRLSFEPSGDLRCNVDPRRTRQAIGNLLTNAIRYTDAGSVTLSADGSGPDIVITVDDTGVGMAPDELEHAFDRFWRAEKSRARSSGGSGLGLSIALQLIRAHTGDIAISSEVGRGTRVTVRLPRHE